MTKEIAEILPGKESCYFIVTSLIAGFASKPQAADDMHHRALGEKSGVAILTDEYLEVRADDSCVPPTLVDKVCTSLRKSHQVFLYAK